jgi:hypothetical protein
MLRFPVQRAMLPIVSWRVIPHGNNKALALAIQRRHISRFLRPASTHPIPMPVLAVPSSSRPYQRTFISITNGDTTDSTTTPETILNECSLVYSSLAKLNEKLGGMAIPPTSPHTSLPFCLLVGNHSSGKSSFINYVLQRKIQKAGVAPTDDTFTVIAPGLTDSDADGPTLVGDPDLGFASLRQFGPTLIHHTQIKYRTSPLNFMLVSVVLSSSSSSFGRTGGE